MVSSDLLYVEESWYLAWYSSLDERFLVGMLPWRIALQENKHHCLWADLIITLERKRRGINYWRVARSMTEWSFLTVTSRCRLEKEQQWNELLGSNVTFHYAVKKSLTLNSANTICFMDFLYTKFEKKEDFGKQYKKVQCTYIKQ